MAFQGPHNGDIRATLALSELEGQAGTSRVLTLSGGRQVVVSIPAGVHNGQEIRLDGQGEISPFDGSRGALILTITLAPSEPAYSLHPSGDANAPTEFISLPPPPPNYTLPTQNAYPSGQAQGNFTQYASPGQKVTYSAQGIPDYAQPANYVQPPPQVPVPPAQRRGLSAGLVVVIILLILFVIGGGGLIYYVAVFQPAQVSVQATANAQSTSTAQVDATNTAQSVATAQVNATQAAQASATAQAQANATATAIAQVTATATALQNIYTSSTSGSPAYSDALSSPSAGNWDQGQGCAYMNGAYHVSELQKGYFLRCIAENSNYGNYALQVKMSIVQGNYGGIVFRADSTNSKFYLLLIGQNGGYGLYRYLDNNASNAKTFASSFSSLIHTGLNQTNSITVVAKGNTIYVYINGQYLSSFSDSSLSSGQIGLIADSTGDPTEAAYSQLQIWTL